MTTSLLPFLMRFGIPVLLEYGSSDDVRGGSADTRVTFVRRETTDDD